MVAGAHPFSTILVLYTLLFQAVRRCYFVEQRGAGGVSTPDLDDDDAYDEMEQG